MAEPSRQKPSEVDASGDSTSPEVFSSFGYTDHNRRQSWCELEVFRYRSGRAIAIATECAGNPGMSITNAVECVAQEIVRRLNIDPRQLVLIEHYGHGSYDGREHAETYDLVTFHNIHPDGSHIFEVPRWRRLIASNRTQAIAAVEAMLLSTPSITKGEESEIDF